MLYDVAIRAAGQDLAEVDWIGAMRSNGSLMEVPARNEDKCRARVRLLTERALSVPLEPLVVIPKPEKRFVFRRELPMSFNILVTAWLVCPENNRDESRAMVWDAMDGGAIRVASVKGGGGGYCEVEVGVLNAACEERAEVLVRDRLARACEEHGMEFVALAPPEMELWVERRFVAQAGFSS